MPDSASPVAAKPAANDLALTLNQIRGIYASRVILDPAREVSEIHIVASMARKPKQIVRDVETLLRVKHDVRIDYRIVSLVQIPDEELLRIPIARPVIRRVTEEVTGDQKRIRVEVQGASRLVVGEAYERIDNPAPFHTAAKATIDAIAKLVDHSIDIRLNDAQMFQLGSHEVALVILTCLTDNREETFVGASFLGTRVIESSARATLDALNRRIHNLTLQAPRQDGDEQGGAEIRPV